MQAVTEVVLSTSGESANRELIEEYIFEAIDRLRERDSIENASFTQQTHGSDDTASVSLTLVGDTDPVVDDESARWEQLAQQGLILDWDLNDYTELWDQQADESMQLRLELSDIATEASKLAFDKFAEPPAIVEEYPDKETLYPIGWYTLLHQLTLQQGYDVDDELDAYTQLLRLTLDNLRNHEGNEYTNTRIDEIVESIEEKRVDET